MENTINIETLTLAQAEWLMFDLLQKYDIETFDIYGQKIGIVTTIHELSIMKKLLSTEEKHHG